MAEKQSEELGCTGSHKVRKRAYRPCKNKEEFNKVTQKVNGELEELIDFDGTMVSSKIPILDPMVSPKKTMDQTVASTRQTQDPLTRGYRVYYGEGVQKEIDMSKAFGWEETKDVLDFEKVVSKLEKMLGSEDDAEDRAEEFGYREDKEDMILKEKELQEDKMLEDLLLKKSDSDKEISSNSLEDILKRNIRSLKNIAKSQGIDVDKLIQMIKDE